LLARKAQILAMPDGPAKGQVTHQYDADVAQFQAAWTAEQYRPAAVANAFAASQAAQQQPTVIVQQQQLYIPTYVPMPPAPNFNALGTGEPNPHSSRANPDTVRAATVSGYAKFYSRSHDVIRVYDAVGNVIETHEQKGEVKLGTLRDQDSGRL